MRSLSGHFIALVSASLCLGGCASSKLDQRLERIEQNIRVLDQNDRAFEEALRQGQTTDAQFAKLLKDVRQRLEEMRTLTDRIEIRYLGDTAIISVRK